MLIEWLMHVRHSTYLAKLLVLSSAICYTSNQLRSKFDLSGDGGNICTPASPPESPDGLAGTAHQFLLASVSVLARHSFVSVPMSSAVSIPCGAHRLSEFSILDIQHERHCILPRYLRISNQGLRRWWKRP
mmetsp:Transcript_25792/g.65573  ORF Transcript_25792/g.65573 Transcript_25792/m.65573 type:complete len:131 (+) Transcript_25792:64-456(+)